jgi:hypothetical protein
MNGCREKSMRGDLPDC